MGAHQTRNWGAHTTKQTNKQTFSCLFGQWCHLFWVPARQQTRAHTHQYSTPPDPAKLRCSSLACLRQSGADCGVDKTSWCCSQNDSNAGEVLAVTPEVPGKRGGVLWLVRRAGWAKGGDPGS